MQLFHILALLPIISLDLFALADGESNHQFTWFHTLNDSFGNISSLKASDYYVVAGSDNDQCIVFHNYFSLEEKETFTDANDDIKDVDMCEHGLFILAVDVSGKARVYKENDDYEFDLIQTITTDSFGDTSAAYAGAISNDHKNIFFGKESGEVYQYCYNGSKYEYETTIADPVGAISSISLKKSKLVIGENGNSVYIYDVMKSGNTLVQTITLNSTNWLKTHLDYMSEKDDDYHHSQRNGDADEEYYLTIWSPADSYVLIYKEEGGQF